MQQLANSTLSSTTPQSAPFAVAAGTMKVLVKGASQRSPIALLRSIDGGTTFAPIVYGQNLSPGDFVIDATFDVSEQTAGSMYMFKVLNPDPIASYVVQAFQ